MGNTENSFSPFPACGNPSSDLPWLLQLLCWLSPGAGTAGAGRVGARTALSGHCLCSGLLSPAAVSSHLLLKLQAALQNSPKLEVCHQLCHPVPPCSPVTDPTKCLSRPESQDLQCGHSPIPILRGSAVPEQLLPV